jgi:triosephosphate isomerase
VILCVGEPASVRKRGIAAAKQFIKNQLIKDLKTLHPTPYTLHPRLLIAYEPVWAIGSGKNDTPADAVEMAKFIKKTIYALRPSILYGGSVSGGNVVDYLKYNEIGGALVGGASLNPKEAERLIKKCAESNSAQRF